MAVNHSSRFRFRSLWPFVEVGRGKNWMNEGRTDWEFWCSTVPEWVTKHWVNILVPLGWGALHHEVSDSWVTSSRGEGKDGKHLLKQKKNSQWGVDWNQCKSYCMMLYRFSPSVSTFCLFFLIFVPTSPVNDNCVHSSCHFLFPFRKPPPSNREGKHSEPEHEADKPVDLFNTSAF